MTTLTERERAEAIVKRMDAEIGPSKEIGMENRFPKELRRSDLHSYLITEITDAISLTKRTVWEAALRAVNKERNEAGDNDDSESAYARGKYRGRLAAQDAILDAALASGVDLRTTNTHSVSSLTGKGEE